MALALPKQSGEHYSSLDKGLLKPINVKPSQRNRSSLGFPSRDAKFQSKQNR